jgi:hypothetical protein
VKDHAMTSIRTRKGPHDLADLIHKHDPNASLETIANIVSEWGAFSDDHRLDAQESVDIETAKQDDQRQSGNLNIR